MKILKLCKMSITFLTNGIWRVTDNEVGRLRYHIYNFIKIIILTVRRYTGDGVMTRAAALTYSTLFSVVPILALLFAIARGFGLQSMVYKLLKDNIGLDNSTVNTLMGFINSYLERTKSGVFIGVGLFLLLWAIISLISNIERNMNSIWLVHKPRSLFRKITDYCSLLIIIPVVIVAMGGISIFMTTFLKQIEDYDLVSSTLRFFIELAPFFIAGVIFTAMFIFIPNTKVMLKHAIVPGFLTGIAFQGFQYFYIHSQMWVSNYNAIYGSFAAIPLFLFWAYVSWDILLFGAQMSYVSQNVQLFNFDKEATNISRRYHDYLCIIIMSLVCKRFEGEECEPYTAGELTRETKIPLRLVKSILLELQQLKLIYEKEGDDKSTDTQYLPATDIGHITLSLLMERLTTHGSESFKIDRSKRYAAQWRVLEEAQNSSIEMGKETLLKDLVFTPNLPAAEDEENR